MEKERGDEFIIKSPANSVSRALFFKKNINTVELLWRRLYFMSSSVPGSGFWSMDAGEQLGLARLGQSRTGTSQGPSEMYLLRDGPTFALLVIGLVEDS